LRASAASVITRKCKIRKQIFDFFSYLNLRGMNPRMRDPPPRRAIAKTLVLTTSIFFLQFKLISSGKNSFFVFCQVIAQNSFFLSWLTLYSANWQRTTWSENSNFNQKNCNDPSKTSLTFRVTTENNMFFFTSLSMWCY
jgi:hypothetical protein